MNKSKTYNYTELQSETGLTPPTIKKYEELGLIPYKKSCNNKTKIYFAEGVQRAKIIGYLIEKIGLSTTAIKIIFEILSIFNIDISNVITICDRLVSPELQKSNAIKKLKKGRRQID